MSAHDGVTASCSTSCLGSSSRASRRSSAWKTRRLHRTARPPSRSWWRPAASSGLARQMRLLTSPPRRGSLPSYDGVQVLRCTTAVTSTCDAAAREHRSASSSSKAESVLVSCRERDVVVAGARWAVQKRSPPIHSSCVTDAQGPRCPSRRAAVACFHEARVQAVPQETPGRRRARGL